MIAAALVRALVGVACWLPPVAGPVVQPFEPPPCRWCAGHVAIGYAARPDEAVLAPVAGTVSFAGMVAGRRFVSLIPTPHGIPTTQGDHLVTLGGLDRLDVRPGQQVARGQRVGAAPAAATGQVVQVSLSLRVRGVHVDPTPWIALRVGPARLLPTDGSAPRARPGPARTTRLECPAARSGR